MTGHWRMVQLQGERRAHVRPLGDFFGERRTDQHQRERDHDEDRERDGQPERDQLDLPPWPRFLDVVGLVQRADDRVDAGRGAPDGPEHAQGEQPAVLLVGNLEDLILDDGEHLAGRDAGEVAGDRVEEPRDGKEADDRDEEEQRRKERQEEVVRQLRREAQAVIREDLAIRARRQLLPGDGDFQRTEHQRTRARSLRPVPTVGVQDGASLAGNDSADSSCTRSSDVKPTRSSALRRTSGGHPRDRLRRSAPTTPGSPPTPASSHPANGSLTKALHGERAAADAHEPARESELLARAIPPAALPDAFHLAVRCQIQSVRVSHAADQMQVWGQVVLVEALM